MSELAPLPDGSLSRRVGAGMLWSQASKMVEVTLTFGTAVLVIRGLNPLGFGTYSLLTNLAGAASVFIPVVTSDSLGAYLPRLGSNPERLFIVLLVAVLRAAVILVVTLTALALWKDLAAAIGTTGLPLKVGIVAACYWISLDMLNTVSGYYSAELEIRPLAVWRTVGLSATLAAVVALAATNSFTTVRVLVAVGGGYAIAAAGLVAGLRRAGAPRRAEAGRIREALAFTPHTWLIGVLGFTLATQIDILLIGALTDSPAEAAYYATAVGVVGRAQILLMSGWAGLIIPAFGHTVLREANVQLRNAWRRAAQLLLLVSLPINALLLVNAHALVRELFGVTYDPAGRLLVWVCAFNLATSLLVNPVCVGALWALDAQRTLALFRVAAAVLNLALAFALIPRYGALGAVIATGASAVTSAAVEYELSRRRGANSYPVPVAVAGAAAAALSILPSLLVGSAGKPGLVAGLVAGVVVYVAVLLAMRPLRADDVAAAAAIHPVLDNRVLRAFSRR